MASSSEHDQLDDALVKIKDLEKQLSFAVVNAEKLSILVEAMEISHERDQMLLKSKILMLEDFKKGYAIVSDQRAVQMKATMTNEITDLQSKLAKAIYQNDQLREYVLIYINIL